eukprot:g8619.t1
MKEELGSSWDRPFADEAELDEAGLAALPDDDAARLDDEDVVVPFFEATDATAVPRGRPLFNVGANPTLSVPLVPEPLSDPDTQDIISCSLRRPSFDGSDSATDIRFMSTPSAVVRPVLLAPERAVR